MFDEHVVQRAILYTHVFVRMWITTVSEKKRKRRRKRKRAHMLVLEIFGVFAVSFIALPLVLILQVALRVELCRFCVLAPFGGISLKGRETDDKDNRLF
jgi:hypothetical protein